MIVKHWSSLPEQPVLHVGNCQLWLAWLDEEDPASFQNILSKDELLRAGRLRNYRTADRFRVARGILRTLLGRYLAFGPEQLVFSYGPNGKPELAGGIKRGLSFNVSHSGGMAVYAIANGFEVGVDVEEIHPINNLEATASFFLSPDELDEFQGLPVDRKLERFFTLWTSREAILKAFGFGFSNPFWDKLVMPHNSSSQSGWQNQLFENKRIFMLNPAEGFKGALACL